MLAFQLAAFMFVFVGARVRATHLSGPNCQTEVLTKIVAHFLIDFRAYGGAVSTARSDMIMKYFSKRT